MQWKNHPRTHSLRFLGCDVSGNSSAAVDHCYGCMAGLRPSGGKALQ